MILDLIVGKSSCKPYVHDNVGIYLMPNNDVVDGVVTRGNSTYKEVNFSEVNSRYKSSDFSIANILEVGAYGMLSPTYISEMSNMAFADKFQNFNITAHD